MSENMLTRVDNRPSFSNGMAGDKRGYGVSKQWGQQAGEAFQESLQEGGMEAFGHVAELTGMMLVAEEDIAEAGGHGGIVNDDVTLEVVLEGAEVNVGGAAGTEGVIDHHELGVEEAVSVEPHAHARLGHFAQVAAAGPFHEACIGAQGHYEAYVNTTQGGHLQGEEHGFGRQEIGCLHHDGMLGAGNGVHVALHNLRIG